MRDPFEGGWQKLKAENERLREQLRTLKDRRERWNELVDERNTMTREKNEACAKLIGLRAENERLREAARHLIYESRSADVWHALAALVTRGEAARSHDDAGKEFKGK